MFATSPRAACHRPAPAGPASTCWGSHTHRVDGGLRSLGVRTLVRLLAQCSCHKVRSGAYTVPGPVLSSGDEIMNKVIALHEDTYSLRKERTINNNYTGNCLMKVVTVVTTKINKTKQNKATLCRKNHQPIFL